MYMYIHTHRSMEANVYKNYCIYVPLIWQYCIAGKNWQSFILAIGELMIKLPK